MPYSYISFALATNFFIFFIKYHISFQLDELNMHNKFMRHLTKNMDERIANTNKIQL